MLSFLSRRELFVHIALYAIGLGALAKITPLWAFIPCAVAVSLGHYWLIDRAKRSRYKSIIEGARAAHIESIPAPEEVKSRKLDDLVFESLKEVTAELEDKYFQLVEKNIQLLSLKEISLTIISSVNESRIVDAVHGFLVKGLGFKEVFVGIINQEQRELHLYMVREAFGESRHVERVVPLEQIDGLLRKSVVTRKSVLMKDAEMHPIGRIQAETIFGDSTMKSYIIVPMVKSSFSQKCWKSHDCILKNDAERARGAGGMVTPSPDARPLEEGICPACKRIPVLGIVGVTDGFKASGLSQVDLVAVETLALQVSTILENSQLYGELKNEETFRDNVINSMINGLITADVQGTIRLVNEAAERLTGYSADELRGTAVDNLIIDPVGSGREGPVTRTLRRGERVFQREVLLAKKDGSKLPIVLNTSLLVDEEKKVQGTIAVFLDITRLKRMEEKIIHLDKLAALGRFSSSMAHEIRNPLTGIVAGLQYLQRTGGIPEEQNENIAFILGEVRRIDRLISDILHVIQIKELVYHPADLQKIIKNGITSVQEMAENKGIEIALECPEETRAVSLDGDRIAQVMINLLKNAIEASSDGATVEVRFRFPSAVDDVLFDEYRDFVIIQVEDHGVGFSEEEKVKIFEPFFTTKKEGTGLGLYVSHSIVERHGGYLFLESEKGKGSVFSVYLPIEKVQYGGSSEIGHPAGR
jgi:PAS domain S-box-containing protein